jgi:hypothetical protein
MSEHKRFKAFRSELTESEYKETLTGYPNRGIPTSSGAIEFGPERLAQINAMLNAISRSTFFSPNEAFIRIKTRLNLLMLDFPWTPYLWQDGGTGPVTLTVTLFGRVDGIDGNTGNVVMNGKANPTAGLQEFTLLASIEMAEDGLYRVNAKLMPKADAVVAEEGVEVDGDTIEEENDNGLRTMFHHPKGKAVVNKSGKVIKIYRTERSARKHAITGKPVNEETELDEMAQTPARQRDMEHKIQRHDVKAQRGYEAKMNKTGKAAERGRKQEDKHDTAVRRLIARDTKEYESEKLYGRGGKIVKGKSKPVKEAAEQIDELSKATKDAYVAKRGSQLSSMLSGHTRGKQLTGKQQANAVKGIKQATGMSEELVGGQKKIDANKNGKLDAQDFKMLRAKKKPVKEETVAEAKKFKAWTPRLDKLMKNRDAVRSKPKKTVKEDNTTYVGGISLQQPDPTVSQADQSGKGRRFHKKAQKGVFE